MCGKLMERTELFESHFLETMVGLSDDKVINVRLILAEIVQKHISKEGAMSSSQAILNLRDKLKQDVDEEVKEIFE